MIPDVVHLTGELLSFETWKGKEEAPARFLGELLSENGFRVFYDKLAEGRLSLIAEKGLSGTIPPVILTGHLDTVPSGKSAWKENPWCGTIKKGRIFGRGSSDMKGGVAAMVCAAIQAFNGSGPRGGVRLIFTAGEEPGCLGARHLAASGFIQGKATGIIIGEPTSNIPLPGHKGAIYLNASISGKTAHSSMPHLGVNAIYKAAKAISRIENFNFTVEQDDQFGLPTINVGMFSGGENLNSVPDHAEFTIDIRTTPETNHREILEKLALELGADVTITKLADLPAVTTDESSLFLQLVKSVCGMKGNRNMKVKPVSYVTDGAVFQQIYDNAPAIILGPGEPDQAHRTDEFCYVSKLKKAVDIYRNILLKY